MDPTAWVIALFINGVTYMGIDNYPTENACQMRGLADSGAAQFRCVPVYGKSSPAIPPDKSFWCSGTECPPDSQNAL